MKTLIVTATYGGFTVQGSPFHNSLNEVGFEGQIGIHQSAQFIGNRIRMYGYLEVLKQVDSHFDTVILTDCRDVLFQLPPETIPHGDLDFYLEDSSKTIGSCAINSEKMESVYGPETLAKVAHRPISCAGVVVGSKAGVRRYLEAFVNEVDRLPKDNPYSQMIHNKLLWDGAFGSVNLIDNEHGPVYTVGHCDSITVKNHKIYNRRGILPHIVHQYDRHVRSL